jgi:transposase
MVLRLLSDRRDDLVAEPTPTLSRLHVLLGDLQPGGAERNLTAQRAAVLLGRLRPVARVDIERKRIAPEVLADVRRLDQRITAATKAIGEAVTASGTTLTKGVRARARACRQDPGARRRPHPLPRP